MTEKGLALSGIFAGYGPMTVIHDVSLAVLPGRTIALLGRNGMGKTTLLRTIAGRLSTSAGSIRLDGRDITALAPSARCRAGLAFVPQERQIFRELTVHENLRIADLRRGWSVEHSFELFPQLKRRMSNMGSQLSGGEQQMLAIARALMGAPRYLLLDEPFEGLAPIVIEQLSEALATLKRETGIAMIIVEQHARLVLEFADEGEVMESGGIVMRGSSSGLLDAWAQVEAYLTPR